MCVFSFWKSWTKSPRSLQIGAEISLDLHQKGRLSLDITFLSGLWSLRTQRADPMVSWSYWWILHLFKAVKLSLLPPKTFRSKTYQSPLVQTLCYILCSGICINVSCCDSCYITTLLSAFFLLCCSWMVHSPPHAEDQTDGQEGRRERK